MPPRRPTPEQQIAIDSIRKIEAALTDRFQSLALGVSRDIRFHRQPLDEFSRLSLVQRIDRALDPVYGVSRSLVKDGDLYRLITNVMEETAENVFQHNLDLAKNIVDRRDPTLWRKLEAQVLSGPRKGEEGWEYLVRMFESDASTKSRLLRSGKLDPQRKWVPKEKWNTKSGYNLSDRLWLQKQSIRRQINDVIREAVRNGTDPLDLAQEFEQYLKPAARSGTRTTADGREIRVNQTNKPRSGYGNFAARRLAITEVQRINAQAALDSVDMTPGANAVKWVKSNAERDEDQCDDNARGSSNGMPPGVYRVEDAPLLPSHPLCRCVYVVQFDQSDEWIDDLVGKYLNDVEAA